MLFPIILFKAKTSLLLEENNCMNWPSRICCCFFPPNCWSTELARQLEWVEKNNFSSLFFEQKLALWQNSTFSYCQQHVILYLKTKVTLIFYFFSFPLNGNTVSVVKNFYTGVKLSHFFWGGVLKFVGDGIFFFFFFPQSWSSRTKGIQHLSSLWYA